MKKVLYSLSAIVIAGCLIIFVASGFSKKGNYTPRTNQNHKVFGISGANEYLSNIRNNVATGDINPQWVFDARAAVDKLAKNTVTKNLGLNWNELGPDNIGGRTRAILIDRNNTNIMYAGGVSGGLWKSTTGGDSWVAVNDFAQSIIVSCIAQAADGSIYIGTGEGLSNNGYLGVANGGSNFIGKGIYKSTDGITFTLLPSTVPTVVNSSSAAWAFINRLACDQVNPLRVYAATNNGLRASDDGGNTWIWPVKLGNGSDDKRFSQDVKVSKDGLVIASIGINGNNPHFYCFVSPNGNEGTFKLKTMPTAGYISRLEVAVSPSNSNFVYGCTAKASDGSLEGIYMSIDTGSTWTVIGAGGSSTFQPLGDQGWYDNVIVVHPTQPDHIFVGGLDMWEWRPGMTWTQKSLWYLDRTSSYYIHADHHIYIFHPNDPNIMFIGSDGGISRSIDGGNTFTTMDINYNTVQSYALACSPTGWIMTGCQDNGTLFLPRSGAFPKHGVNIMGGDGGWPAFSYINPQAFFATVYNAGTGRSPDGGTTFYPASDGSNPFFSNRMKALSTGGPGASDYPAAFVTPLLMWESFNDTYSADSIVFWPEPVMNEKMGKGITDLTHFSGIYNKGNQASASIIPGSLKIVSGSTYVTDDYNGNLIQSGTIVGTIDYNTGHYDVTFLSAPVAGANILASYNIEFAAASNILIHSNNKPGIFYYTTPTTITYGDTVKIQDIVQSQFYVGLDAGIWMTRQALFFSQQPLWFKVANFTVASGQSTQCMALSHDGNYLFAGTSNGLVYRLSNLRSAHDSLNSNYNLAGCVVETKQIKSFSNRAVTSIAVDPNNAARVVVTLGNYGNDVYVYFSTNALDSVPTFTTKQGTGTTMLPKMPVYSSVIPIQHPGTVLLGTEYGAFATDNIDDAQPQWSDENTGLAHVPVFMLRQQEYFYWNSSAEVNNYGSLYAGTHGRGIFECTQYTGINEPYEPGSNFVNAPLTISIYPNPVSEQAALSFTLPTNGDVQMKVYDMTGKLIRTENIQNMTKGLHTYTFNCSGIKRGTYIIQMISGKKAATAKFVKM